MPGEILAGLAGAVLPSIGAQAAAQQQRRWALQDLEAQNFYNSPAEQLRRLKEAGLPAAAFFSGGVSSQSDQPRTTNVDPTLGIAEGVQNFFQNRIQKAQIKAIEADARGKSADADIKEIDANIAKSVDPSRFDSSGAPLNRQTVKRLEEQNLLDHTVRLKSIEANIQQRVLGWQERYGNEMNTAQLNNLSADIARKELEIRDAELMREFQRDFIRLFNEGELMKSLGRLIGMYALKSVK